MCIFAFNLFQLKLQKRPIVKQLNLQDQDEMIQDDKRSNIKDRMYYEKTYIIQYTSYLIHFFHLHFIKMVAGVIVFHP